MISLADLILHLKVETDLDNELIEEYEAAAVNIVQDQSGRYFGPLKLATEHFDVCRFDQRTLLLKDPARLEDISASPAITAPIVEELEGSVYAVVDPDTYIVDGDFLVRLNDYWPYGQRSVKVTYWVGYAQGSEPADVRAVVMEIVAHKYRNRGDEAAYALPEHAKMVIHSYRKVRV